MPTKPDLGIPLRLLFRSFPRKTPVPLLFSFYIFKFQTCDKESVNLKEERVVAFHWTIQNFQAWAAEQMGKMEPLTSPTYVDKEHRWRGVLTCENNLFLKLLAAMHPGTAEVR